MKRLSQFAKRVLHYHDTSLLLEQVDSGFIVTEIHTQPEKRTVMFESSVHIPSLEKFKKPHHPLKAHTRVVLALDARHAATIVSTVTIPRENPTLPIAEGELDAMLFHALWNFLNSYRPIAAKKLGVSELDLVVANIAVCGVRIQTHKVFNPLDFSGKEVFIEFRGTFITRALLPELERISEFISEPIIVIERGTILSEALQESNTLVCIYNAYSSVYVTRGTDTLHVGDVEWGVVEIVKKLAVHFGVSRAMVHDMLNTYAKNQVSEKIRNIIERAAKEEVRVLMSKMSHIVPKADTKSFSRTVYTVLADTKFPAIILAHQKFQEAHILSKAHTSSLVHKWGAHTPPLHEQRRNEIVTLIEYPYLHPQYAFLNQLLRRRVKWLVPHEK
jgi:hypothetical protein